MSLFVAYSEHRLAGLDLTWSQACNRMRALGAFSTLHFKRTSFVALLSYDRLCLWTTLNLQERGRTCVLQWCRAIRV